MYEKPQEEDASLALEMSTINDNVEYMEDRLTSQAVAADESKKQKKPRWRSSYGGKFRKTISKSSRKMDTLMKVIKAEISEHQDINDLEDRDLSEEDGEMESTNLSDDILGLNIKEEEVNFYIMIAYLHEHLHLVG